MAPLRILIVDDEAPARSRLRDLLADCGLPLVVAGEAANGRAALEFAAIHPVDVVLLDVRMPELGGIEVAQHLHALPVPPAVIFTTAYHEFAVRAFEVQAIDYLLKPIRAARLHEALLRAAARSASRADLDAVAPARTHLPSPERGRIHLVPVDAILYLRAEQKYVTARTLEREFLLEEPLTRLEVEFPDRFVRIHRNCLVAKAHVAAFERADDDGEPRWTVLLKGIDEKLPVSRRQQHVLKELAR